MVYDYDITDYLVSVSPVGIQGILQDGSLSLPFGANITQSNLASMTDIRNAGLNVLHGAMNKVNSLAGGLVGAYKQSTHSVKEFIKTYENSGDIDISFSMLIVPGKFGMPSSYSQIIQGLAKLTLPKVDGNVMYSQLVEDMSPLANNWKALDGQLCSITIGSWFTTEPIFWCSSANASFATTIDTQGRPSHLIVSFSFTPYRPLTTDDVASWIS